MPLTVLELVRITDSADILASNFYGKPNVQVERVALLMSSNTVLIPMLLHAKPLIICRKTTNVPCSSQSGHLQRFSLSQVPAFDTHLSTT